MSLATPEEFCKYFRRVLETALRIGHATRGVPVNEHPLAMQLEAEKVGWELVYESSYRNGRALLFASPQTLLHPYRVQVGYRVFDTSTTMLHFQLKLRADGLPLPEECPVIPHVRVLPYVTYLPSPMPPCSIVQCFGVTYAECKRTTVWLPTQLGALDRAASRGMLRLFRDLSRRKLPIL